MPAFPSSQPSQRTEQRERLCRGAAGTFEGRKPLSRRPHPRLARSSAETKLVRVSLPFSPQTPNKTEKKISEEVPAFKMRCKHLRLEISISPLSVQCVDSGL